jgi:acetyltransferase-like isoleucine patch superfamily enzyme
MKKWLKLFVPVKIQNFIIGLYYKVKYKLVLDGNCFVRQSSFGPNCYIGDESKISCSTMGNSSYIANNSSITYTKIGRFCAIGDNVRICIGNHPTSDFVSVHPCFYSKYGQGTPSHVKDDLFSGHKFLDSEEKFVVEVGNDVWIGNDVSILDGIRIGNGAIIGIGSVVTKDVEPYSIVGGIPAKLIRMRFTEEEIIFLINLEWWNKPNDWIRENAGNFLSIKKLIDAEEKL